MGESGRYTKLIQDLEKEGRGAMVCRGNSMLPILKNPSLCVYEKQGSYKVGDIVFCKVRGRFIDAHKVTAMKEFSDGRKEYRIENNHGLVNGWTSQVFGRVVEAMQPGPDVRGWSKSFR